MLYCALILHFVICFYFPEIVVVICVLYPCDCCCGVYLFPVIVVVMRNEIVTGDCNYDLWGFA